MKFSGYFSTVPRKVNTVFLLFLMLCVVGCFMLSSIHDPIEELREAKLKTIKSLKILNDLTFNGQKVIHHESKFKRNFTQKIEDFEHELENILATRDFNLIKTDTSKVRNIVSAIFEKKMESNQEQVLLSDIKESWFKVKQNFLLIRDQPTYKDSIIISYDPENEYLLDKSYTSAAEQVNATTNVIFIKHKHHITTLNPDLKKAWHYDDIYSEALKNQLEKLHGLYLKEENTQMASFDTTIWYCLFVLIAYIMASGFYLHRQVYQPLSKLQLQANLAKDNNYFTPTSVKNTELSDIQELIVKQDQQIATANSYIEGITRDDKLLEKVAIDGVLVEALHAMREKINAVRKEEDIRNWETRGLAEFSEILRTENNNIYSLTEKLTNKFVQYLGAVQGALFLIEKDEEAPYLQLVSSYAYDRKKHLHKKIMQGEGLVGQAWQEGEPIYLSNVPENHFTIKSGLGHASPKFIFLVPIKDANATYGVLELASLNPFEDHQKRFVEQVCVTIASSISSVRLSEQTNSLLTQSQEMTQQMKLHEEEMRQNMEELKATQEDALRREKDKDQELQLLHEKLLAEKTAWEEQLNSAQSEIEKLRKQSQSSSQGDPQAEEALNKELEELKAAFDAKEKDLLETIKIKDMRIEKLRKKLNEQ